MKLLAVVGLVSLLSQPAGAITCEQVRGYVQTYGIAAVMDYVKKAGISEEEVQRGRACLRRDIRGHRRQLGSRFSNRGWQSN
jgi:hypothetical protein